MYASQLFDWKFERVLKDCDRTTCGVSIGLDLYQKKKKKKSIGLDSCVYGGDVFKDMHLPTCFLLKQNIRYETFFSQNYHLPYMSERLKLNSTKVPYFDSVIPM